MSPWSDVRPDRVFGYTGVVQRPQQAFEAVVERQHMRVIAAQVPGGLLALFRRHIGPQLDLRVGILGSIALRRSGQRKMRRPERKHQQERIAPARLLADEAAGVVGLRNCVVAGPIPGRVVVAFEIERVIVVVRAFAGFPVVEPEAFVRRDVRQAAAVISVRTAVEMPFSDVPGTIARSLERLCQGGSVRLQFHVVDEDAIGEGILPSHEAGAKGTANGRAGDRVIEADAFGRQPVETGVRTFRSPLYRVLWAGHSSGRRKRTLGGFERARRMAGGRQARCGRKCGGRSGP